MMKIRYVVMAFEHNKTCAYARTGDMPFVPTIGQHINFWIEKAWRKMSMHSLRIKDTMWDETSHETIVFLDDADTSSNALKSCGFKRVSLDALTPMAA